jgi:hypothetical protein
MSRLKFLVVGFVLSSAIHAQDRSEIWLSAGVKSPVGKHLVASIGTNARVRFDGKLQTLFQDIGIKSEHLAWFRPSIEYRLITSYDQIGNFSLSNRLNFNADFRYKKNNIKYGTRLRYQTFIGNSFSSGGDLDPAFRIKPYAVYELENSKITPELSVEFFYNPVNQVNGNRFNRYRIGLTGTIDLPGKNELSVTYYYGRKFNTGNPYNEHLISLEYGFEWKRK